MKREDEHVNRSCSEDAATTEFRLRCKELSEVDEIWRICAMNKPSADKTFRPPSVLSPQEGQYVERVTMTEVCADATDLDVRRINKRRPWNHVTFI